MNGLPRWIRERWLVLAPAALLLLAGCRKAPAPAPSPAPASPPAPATAPALPTGLGPGVGGALPAVGRLDAANDLKQFWLFYNTQATTGTPPRGLQDLSDLRLQAPHIYQAIQDGTYVVNWNARPAGGAAILAYVRDAPTRGGPAVMLDGSVQNLTPQQFKAGG